MMYKVEVYESSVDAERGVETRLRRTRGYSTRLDGRQCMVVGSPGSSCTRGLTGVRSVSLHALSLHLCRVYAHTRLFAARVAMVKVEL